MKYQQKLFILHLNRASSCCRSYSAPLQENQTIQDVINQWQHESALLTQGVEVDNCGYCWKVEQQGKLSYRNYQGQGNEKFNRIEIFLSNLCNQMCSYCSPKYSSMWEESISTHGMFEHVSNTAIENLHIPLKNQTAHNRLEELQSYILSCDDNSVSLALLGGEPLMQINSLQQLLMFSRDKIKNLSIVTNLNPPKPKFLEWLLENFSNHRLQIQISLDATPEYNHVPRAGFDSLIFEQNLNLVKQHSVDIEFLCTVSALSIFDLPNFLSWVEQSQFNSNFYLINNPSCLDPLIVPIEFRRRILEQIVTVSPMLIDQVLNDQQPSVDLKLFEQYNYLTQYFTRTNTDLTKINNPLFQEYWQWLNKRFKK
jgi:organic radical activating enzyme